MMKKIKKVFVFVLVSFVLIAFLITLIPLQLIHQWIGTYDQPTITVDSPDGTSQEIMIDTSTLDVTTDTGEKVEATFEPTDDTVQIKNVNVTGLPAENVTFVPTIN